MSLKQVRKRNYLGRDFDSLREQLLEYANLYYKDRISDFSENSLGGLFLDMAAYIGDNLSFYLDHQFNELDSQTAIEPINLQRHLARTGAKITGNSPASVICTFSIRAPSQFNTVTGKNEPIRQNLPILKAGTLLQSKSGIDFELLHDIDFSEVDSDGNYYAQFSNFSNGELVLSRDGKCTSGSQFIHNITFDSFIPFRRVMLPENNVSEIISVTDSEGNSYYEVNDLSEDTIYMADKNYSSDKEQSPNVLKLISAPYRFTTNTDIVSRETTLIFGGGDASSYDDDIIPDPSQFALSLPNSKTLPRISLNPNDLLKTKTLGVTGTNVRVKIVYRAGGGLNHNVGSRTIDKITGLKLFFPFRPPTSILRSVTDSLSVINFQAATGAENAPTIDELRAYIPSLKNSQQRLVTKEDLLSRVYTIPSEFGKVFRAAISTNKNNNSAILYIVSRDSKLFLKKSGDSLKRSLTRYLNEYRLISDSIDILDCPILNFTIEYRVSIDPRMNSTLINDKIKNAIEEYFDTTKSQINKPINVSEVIQLILSIDGVQSMPTDGVKFKSAFGSFNNKQYSNYVYSIDDLELKGIIYPPEGGIFELKYPSTDIIQGVM